MIWLEKIILIFSLIYKPTIGEADYCSLCVNASHTLCKYPVGPSKNCINYKHVKFTDELKKYTVDIHNDIRDHIASGKEIKGILGGQPTASNMNILRWDEELAEIAQRWADQCIPVTSPNQHDECRKTGRVLVGAVHILCITNLGIKSTRGKHMIGQYTQLVWAETKYVGCGMSTFTDPGSENSDFLHRLVCNYGPRGNLVGSSVYEKGPPCQSCPKRCNTMRGSLCQDDSELSFESNSETTFKEPFKNFIVRSILIEQDLKILNNLLKDTLVVTSERLSEEKHPSNSVLNMNSALSILRNSESNVIAIYIPSQSIEIRSSKIQELGFSNWTLDDEIISLPNNVLLKREKGIWKNGKCYCRMVYRSCALRTSPLLLIYLWMDVFLFFFLIE